MKPLEKTLRNQLEKAITEAREVAEAAGQAALGQLGVGESTPYSHLTEEARKLRRKLRVHGRQLGDRRDPKLETQEVGSLVEEVAYEHWHRMLFARFLAENDLLMYPDPVDPVAVTLEECDDLAADEGAKNGWELAARFAAHMLPQIFRPDSPVFQLSLPPEHQQKLERLLDELPTEVFTASDSLGWVYQFWQGKKKDEVNASEVKIGARELPAVTQLFTEPYMVNFLLDNSLGAWWAVRRLTDADLKRAESEDKLRQKASLLGVPLEYLRFIKGEEGKWTPAAGTFHGWPEKLGELKTLDPCCGSGHFLVAAFLMLVPMRMELEGLSASEAVAAVLRENLHGLEIDQRCVELAAFALALAAWCYPDAGGYRQLPELNLACSGLSISAKKEEWLQLAVRAADVLMGEQERELFADLSKDSLWHTRLKAGMEALYDLFQEAPTLGSLIHPGSIAGDLLRADYRQTATLLQEALQAERQTDEEHERGVVAHGLARAVELLAEQYHWVITNVPYLARGKQSEKLRAFCEKNCPAAKNDLATAFLDRCLEFCVDGGTTSLVLPQNWLFLTSYRKFREKLLTEDTWHLIARLGPGAFVTISGEVVKAILIVLSRGQEQWSEHTENCQARTTHLISGLDVSTPRTAAEKAAQLLTTEIKQVEQAKQLENPGVSIELSNTSDVIRVSEFAFVRGGITTGDSPQYRRCFWENGERNRGWSFQQNSVKKEDEYAGREYSILWENSGGRLAEAALNAGATIAGREAWGKGGIAITYTSSLKCTLYTGELFENIICVMIPRKGEYLSALWCFCSSQEFEKAVRSVNQKLSVDVRYFEKAPVEFEYWQQVAAEKYPNGLPEPYSDDPTQWVSHGHPARSDEPLHVAVARLLGYRWPAELDASMELSDEAHAWVKRLEALMSFADNDGIVCIPPVRGEAPAADRLLDLLAAAYGDAWGTDKLAELLKRADHAGKALETWLRDKFFLQHCKLFRHRPFIWYIWDGLRDGFAALVNYHKLDRRLLETLIYTYLGDWVSRQRQDIAHGVDGAEEKLAAAENLKKHLELILEGETPYDIFVRWKPIEKQPLGWAPDLNDGVRLNIRPFMSVPDVGKKGTGVLREKPNIKWNKDRGKDVESAPWYHLFNGNRMNDHHLSLVEKRKARERAE